MCIVRVQCASARGLRGVRARAAGDGSEGGAARIAVCSDLRFNLRFGMEYPQGFGQAGSAECLPLSSVPPAMTQVADAECEVETYDGFRLGGSSRLAVYLGYLN